MVTENEVENIANRLNLVSREEFEVQKKRIEKLQKDLIRLKTKRNILKPKLILTIS